MRRLLFPALALTLAGACGGPRPAPEPASPAAQVAAPVRAAAGLDSSWATLEAELRGVVARAPGEVAVSVVDLTTGRRLGINDTVTMHAASTMKVPVLAELYRKADSLDVLLDRPIVLRNEFRSIADSSVYSLSPEDDSDAELYARVGQAVTTRELATRMIARSSNLATNVLIERAHPDSIRRLMSSLGASGMNVLRGVEDIPAYRKGMNNTTTAAAFGRVLEAIARCERWSAAACREMVGILAAQEFNEMIPAGLPAGTRVAHKTGWITEIQHDGAIVYPEGRAPYVLVVLTRGIQDTLVAARTAAEVSRMVWTTLEEEHARMIPERPSTRALLDLHARAYVPALMRRHIRQEELWGALDPVIAAAAGRLGREEVGRSAHGRPLQLVRYGSGPTTVLLWSQMHGDESTATRALLDLMNLFATAPEDPRVRRIGERLSVYMLPMLNPDGAERFQRRNAQHIDVNRDARAQATPEGRTLKAVRDRLRPEFGFNLHDQDVRTRVGTSDRLAAFSLLAPPYDEARSMNPVRERATRVAAVLRDAVEPLLGGHITRYDDSFNPRAFGDNMQLWGTSTVLIESGGLRGDPEKEQLRRANFVGILAALDAIASGEYAGADPARYTALPENGRRVHDLLVLGGQVVVPGLEPYRADVAIDVGHGPDGPRSTIADLGDLPHLDARDTLEATGLFVHQAERSGSNGTPAYLGDAGADLVIRTGPDPYSEPVWIVSGGQARKARPARR